MRCTRCDRIAVPQALGRTVDGRLVFGWCLRCMAEERCEVTSVAGEEVPKLSPWRGRIAHGFPSWSTLESEFDTRSWALAALAAVLSGWGLVLLAYGGVLLVRPDLSEPGRVTGTPLLGGGLVLTGIGLGIWLTTLEGPRALELLARIAFWALSGLGFGLLGWGIWQHEPGRDWVAVGLSALAFGLALLARWISWRLSGQPRWTQREDWRQL